LLVTVLTKFYKFFIKKRQVFLSTDFLIFRECFELNVFKIFFENLFFKSFYYYEFVFLLLRISFIIQTNFLNIESIFRSWNDANYLKWEQKSKFATFVYIHLHCKKKYYKFQKKIIFFMWKYGILFNHKSMLHNIPPTVWKNLSILWNPIEQKWGVKLGRLSNTRESYMVSSYSLRLRISNVEPPFTITWKYQKSLYKISEKLRKDYRYFIKYTKISPSFLQHGKTKKFRKPTKKTKLIQTTKQRKTGAKEKLATHVDGKQRMENSVDMCVQNKTLVFPLNKYFLQIFYTKFHNSLWNITILLF